MRYPASLAGGPWLYWLFAEVRAADPQARFVRVPADPDRVERVILELASTFGDESTSAVAERLRSEPEALAATLRYLDGLLAGSPLMIDCWSSLRVTDDVYDAGHAQDGRLKEFRAWLAERARVIPADVAQQTVLVDLPYLAEVVAGPSGAPRGPVIRMEAGYGRIEALWEKWQSRSQDGS